MYKIKAINQIATEKSVGCQLNQNEYEVDARQFASVKLPCRVTVSASGGVTLGEQVDFDQLPETEDTPHIPTEGEAREYRDRLLTESDYTQVSDSPLTEDCKAAFAAYRQSLRNLPEQVGFPTEISWPVMPEVVNR